MGKDSLEVDKTLHENLWVSVKIGTDSILFYDPVNKKRTMHWKIAMNFLDQSIGSPHDITWPDRANTFGHWDDIGMSFTRRADVS